MGSGTLPRRCRRCPSALSGALTLSPGRAIFAGILRFAVVTTLLMAPLWPIAEEIPLKHEQLLRDVRITWRTPPPQAVLKEVPEHLKAALVDSPSRNRPPAGALARVTSADGPWLASQYRRQRQPAQVAGLAWCLVYAGEPEAPALLLSTLKGQIWSQVKGLDRSTLQHFVMALGVVAQTNDTVYQSLERMTRLAWWQENSLAIQGPGEPFDKVSLFPLIGSAYQAVGLSGRPEARRFVKRIRGEPVAAGDARSQAHPPTDHKEELMLAECYLSVFERVGRSEFNRHLFDGAFQQWCVEWGRTEAGRQLLRWAYPPEVFKGA